MEPKTIACMLACVILNWGAMLVAGIVVARNEKKNEKKETRE